MGFYNPAVFFGSMIQTLNDPPGEMKLLSFRFPACHFGKLYGLVMSMSAVISLLQYPCFALVKGALGGDPFFVSESAERLSKHCGGFCHWDHMEPQRGPLTEKLRLTFSVWGAV